MMKVLFVRHAPALSRVNWLRDDMDRPLSDKGVITAKKVFKEMSKIYDTPSVIFCSEALRARETAQLLSKSFKGARLVQSGLLNPGASFEDMKKLLEGETAESVMIVGHEPDLSAIVSALTANGSNLSIDFKKAALVEVDIDEEFRGVLKAVLPPKIFS
jgi:phosphohistidine phosphatase